MNELQPGDVISYTYRTDREYAQWNGDGTRRLIGTRQDFTAWREKRKSWFLKPTERLYRVIWKNGLPAIRKEMNYWSKWKAPDL